MLEDDTRKMIQAWSVEGRSKKEIARMLKINIKTVRRAIDGIDGRKKRIDKRGIDISLLEETYHRCDGYVQRMYEVLTEEHNISIGYSTLTRLVREKGFSLPDPVQHPHVPDVPGDEMQHDTSPYKVKIGGILTRVVLSGLYLRFSKMRYLKFYFSFKRFTMKCFIHEGLTFWQYCAKHCIIDNTNLAVHYGTGSSAIFYDEMERFARNYGFKWQAHEIGHSNRKAGKERNFRTVETNFFPGRSFRTIDDLNEQLFKWATQRYARRPQSKTHLIPIELFDKEKSYLNKLPAYISEPSVPDSRIVDEYGYVSYGGNFYWVPLGKKSKVTIVIYSQKIEVYSLEHVKLITYELPSAHIHNERFFPPEKSNIIPQPNNRKKGYSQESARLRKISPQVCDYLDFILSKDCLIRQKPKFIRDLYYLSCKMSCSLFIKSIQRALEYKIDSIASIERIASQFLVPEQTSIDPSGVSDINYESRKEFIEGSLSEEADLDMYGKLLSEPENKGNNDGTET